MRDHTGVYPQSFYRSGRSMMGISPVVGVNKRHGTTSRGRQNQLLYEWLPEQGDNQHFHRIQFPEILQIRFLPFGGICAIIILENGGGVVQQAHCPKERCGIVPGKGTRGLTHLPRFLVKGGPTLHHYDNYVWDHHSAPP